MTNESAHQLAAMLTASQRADILQLAQIISAPAVPTTDTAGGAPCA